MPCGVVPDVAHRFQPLVFVGIARTLERLHELLHRILLQDHGLQDAVELEVANRRSLGASEVLPEREIRIFDYVHRSANRAPARMSPDRLAVWPDLIDQVSCPKGKVQDAARVTLAHSRPLLDESTAFLHAPSTAEEGSTRGQQTPPHSAVLRLAPGCQEPVWLGRSPTMPHRAALGRRGSAPRPSRASGSDSRLRHRLWNAARAGRLLDDRPGSVASSTPVSRRYASIAASIVGKKWPGIDRPRELVALDLAPDRVLHLREHERDALRVDRRRRGPRACPRRSCRRR